MYFQDKGEEGMQDKGEEDMPNLKSLDRMRAGITNQWKFEG